MTTDDWAIDVHGHYGSYGRPGGSPLLNQWATGDAETVVKRARNARVRWTVVSPLAALLPRGEANAVAGNDEAAVVVEQSDDLLQWSVLHPLQQATYQQTAERLPQAKCMGIKIHPEEHQYKIAEHGKAIFEFAAKHNAIVLAHSGDPFSWPENFVPFANEYPNVRLILAHLGNGGGAAGDPALQVRAIQASRHGNVFVDTSSARSILPGLVEWAVKEIGSDRILFGTDTPLYSTAMHRARIDSADIDEQQKKDILFRNAENLLGIKA